jgi:hypothetical protein
MAIPGHRIRTTMLSPEWSIVKKLMPVAMAQRPPGAAPADDPHRNHSGLKFIRRVEF